MNPFDQAIYKSRECQNRLATQIKKSLRQVDIFKKYLDSIKYANEQYSQLLLQSSERFYQEMISKEVIENEALLCCYDYLFHFMSLVSQNHKTVVNEINTKLVEPFALYIENLKGTNKNLLKSSQDIIAHLENAKAEVLKKQQKYYFKSQEAENHIQAKFEDKSIDNTYMSCTELLGIFGLF